MTFFIFSNFSDSAKRRVISHEALPSSDEDYDPSIDNVFLWAEQTEDGDQPRINASMINNILKNGVQAGLTAQNDSRDGTLYLYLLDNKMGEGESTPDFGVELINNNDGLTVLYNTAFYTTAEDLLVNQGNTITPTGDLLEYAPDKVLIAPLPEISP